MPLQNRVTPFGDLIEDPARGLLMGNRGGRFHDPAQRRLTSRRWASKQWICCQLSFRERARIVWGHGYTELFFLDEVTALAAGHRPCAECRRADARAFQAALGREAGLSSAPSLQEIDRVLHGERLAGGMKGRHTLSIERLPHGAVFCIGNRAYALHRSGALPWSPSGYGEPQRAPDDLVEVLTPPLACRALGAGYAPLWHPTAPATSVDGIGKSESLP